MSELKVKLVNVTPNVATNYLTYNGKNRKHSIKHVKFLTNQMLNGDFLENGESIVFDSNNILLDGQHRLMAIAKSGKSYNIPIVRGAKSLSMATYDTGKNRSASDVLEINNFKYTAHVSNLIKNIYGYLVRNEKSVSVDNSRAYTLTNQQVLEYCQENYEWIKEIIKRCNGITAKSTTRVLSTSKIALISYIIGGKYPSEETYSFIKNLVGVNIQESTAPSYIFTKLYNSKVNKEPLNFYWVLGMSIKAWNFYADGNPAIRHFRFKVTDNLPKPIQLQQRVVEIQKAQQLIDVDAETTNFFRN